MTDATDRKDGREETVADVVAEMRIPEVARCVAAMTDAGAVMSYLGAVADRIYAAHIRELQAEQEVAEDALFKLDEAERRAGNAAAIREVLEDMVKHDDRMTGCDVFLFGHTSCNGKTTAGECHFKSHCARVFRAMEALSAPPRNCDVGTAEEQNERYKRFCSSHYRPNDIDAQCDGCPCVSERFDCELEWGQLPYEAAQEGGE